MDVELKFILLLIVLLTLLILVVMWMLYHEKRISNNFVGSYRDGWGTRYTLYSDGKAHLVDSKGKKATTYWSPVMHDGMPCILIMRGSEMVTFYAIGRRLHRYKSIDE